MGLHTDNEKENGDYRDYWGYTKIMEKRMETIEKGGVYGDNGTENEDYRDYCGFMGITEKKLETIGIIGAI